MPALAVVPEETAEKSEISPVVLSVVVPDVFVLGLVGSSDVLSEVIGNVAALKVLSELTELVASSVLSAVGGLVVASNVLSEVIGFSLIGPFKLF